MKSLHVTTFCIMVLMVCSSFAQDQSRPDGGRSDLRNAESNADVQQDLESPDGVSLQLLPDGGYRLYGRGSGTYDFNEPDEIRGATQDATLRAKAAIAKFLSERVQSNDVMTNITNKLKSLSVATGQTQQASVTKTDVQTRVEQIVATSDVILKGVVVIESKKNPVGDGGTITITLGISSKTKAASEMIQGDSTTNNTSPNPSNPTAPSSVPNLPETKKSNTDF